MKSALSAQFLTQKLGLGQLSQSRSKLAFGLLLAAMAVVLPACDSPDQASETLEPQTTAQTEEDPQGYVGQTVAVSGEVTEVYNPSAFSIQTDEISAPAGEMLVLVSDASVGAAGTGTGTGAGGTGIGTSAGTSTDTGTSTGTSAGPSTDTGTSTGTSAGTSTGTSTNMGAEMGMANVSQGETVQLTGQVQRFTPDLLQGEYGANLDEALISQIEQEYTGEFVLLAAAVQPGAAEAPTSP